MKEKSISALYNIGDIKAFFNMLSHLGLGFDLSLLVIRAYFYIYENIKATLVLNNDFNNTRSFPIHFSIFT